MQGKADFVLRRRVIIWAVIVIALIFVVKLFFIQIVNDQYMLQSDNNTIRNVVLFPPRGMIFDRNGKLLVSNEIAYDVMVIPRMVKPMDTALLCQVLGMEMADFRQKLTDARQYSRYKASLIASQFSKEKAGIIQERLYQFPGFFLESRITRLYDEKIAAHAIGYIGEVDNQDIEKDDYYRSGDYIGKSGVEAFYEKVLRGQKGKSIRLVDVHNRIKGTYKNGEHDVNPVLGDNICMTLDAELQKFAELLMNGKRGSITAIEPATGEVLVMVSTPSYDPNLLIGQDRSKNYHSLLIDPSKPLFNRAVTAKYPPGSTFKMANGLAAMEEEVITPQSCFSCSGPGTQPIKCTHNHKSPLNFFEAIETSCNPYFWGVFRTFLEKAKGETISDRYLIWREHMLAMGFGHKFEGSDIKYQSDGNIPSDNYFNKYYGKGRWNAMTIRSLSIGQGEVELTPLQMANYAATLANRGFYYEPHLVKKIEPDSILQFPKRYTGIDSIYYHYAVEGMYLVFNGHGTARWYRIPELNMCGKTGTAQNPHGKDHSICIAFAPKDNPKIAISVVVENAGFGATWAVPIGTLIIEQYLLGETRRTELKERMLNTHPL
jgi:penicillin-binding protein 2